MLSCEICELFKNNYFKEQLWMSASKLYLKETPTQVFSREFCELFKKIYFSEDLRTADSMKHQCGSLSLKKLQAWRLEPAVAQVFLCEFCEIFRKAF